MDPANTVTPLQAGPRERQLAELGVLKEFARICDGNSLRYYVLGGSLLGAVRHRGFIPWDDDIDVGMPRPDYDRFWTICESTVDASRFSGQTYFTARAYPFNFGKFLLSDSTQFEKPTAHLAMKHAIGIDVFPLDGSPNGHVARALHSTVLKAIKLRLSVDVRRGRPVRVALWVLKLAPRRWAIGACEALAARMPFDQSVLVVNPGGAWGYDKECVPQEWFAGGAELDFEDMRVRAPSNWDGYLAHIYGDYMRLPPEEKRVSHHEVISATLPASGDGGDLPIDHNERTLS